MPPEDSIPSAVGRAVSQRLKFPRSHCGQLAHPNIASTATTVPSESHPGELVPGNLPAPIIEGQEVGGAYACRDDPQPVSVTCRLVDVDDLDVRRGVPHCPHVLSFPCTSGSAGAYDSSPAFVLIHPVSHIHTVWTRRFMQGCTSTRGI